MIELLRWLAAQPWTADADAVLAEAKQRFPAIDAAAHEEAWKLVGALFGAGYVAADQVRAGKMSDAAATTALRVNFPGVPEDVRDAALARGYYLSR